MIGVIIKGREFGFKIVVSLRIGLIVDCIVLSVEIDIKNVVWERLVFGGNFYV